MKVETLARVTSASLAKNTGRTWDEWLAILKKAGASNWPRKDVVVFLRTKHKQSPWYQQIIATGHEQVLGRRIEGQNAKGLYSVAGSRTVAVSAARLTKFLLSEKGVALWLNPLDVFEVEKGAQFELPGGVFGEIRTILRNERKFQLRFRWQDEEWAKPSVCTLIVGVRSQAKCMLGFSHDDLPNTRVKEQLRRHWKRVLDEIIAQFPNK